MKKITLRKIFPALLAALMLVSLSSCGKDDPSAAAGTETSAAETQEEASAVVHDEMRDISSSELVKEIRIGWSLGNTLDADGSGVSAETAWGNVKTTKEMITAVKDAGFNIVRIPVTWRPHLDAENNIDEAWMDRVQEVVDYAYGQGMFVIVNAHHEEWYDPYYDTADASCEKLTKLWQQIGTRFADYDERLIFEGLNEPRKRNTPVEWNGGDQEGWDVVNQLNSAFIAAVRGLGGNNAKRHLMIPTYAASVTNGAVDALQIPDDDKVIVSLHAYYPYNFALGDSLTANKFSPDASSASDITNLMNTIKKTFIDKGVPVIMGEMGARNKANESDRGVWAEFYVSKAREIGVPCIVWDNGAFSGSGENFGLLERRTCTWKFPLIIG